MSLNEGKTDQVVQSTSCSTVAGLPANQTPTTTSVAGPSNATNSNSTSEKPPLDECKRRGIQNQLTLCLHSTKCMQESEMLRDFLDEDEQIPAKNCGVSYCQRMTGILKHIKETHCQNDNCEVRACKSTRQIIKHWQSCLDAKCPVCKNVRQMAELSRPLFQQIENQEAEEMEVFGNYEWHAQYDDEKRRKIRSKCVSQLLKGTLIPDLAKANQFVDFYEEKAFQKCDTEQRYLADISDKIYRGRRELIRTAGQIQRDESGKCPICLLDVLRDGCNYRQLPCNHIFHSACISTWLNQRQCCPLCRRSFLN